MSDETTLEMAGAAAEIDVATPVIVDMGKTKAKQIKRLKKGKGPLLDEVVTILDEVADVLGDELDGKTMVPIVILYKEKKKKKRTRIRFPFG